MSKAAAASLRDEGLYGWRGAESRRIHWRPVPGHGAQGLLVLGPAVASTMVPRHQHLTTPHGFKSKQTSCVRSLPLVLRIAWDPGCFRACTSEYALVPTTQIF